MRGKGEHPIDVSIERLQAQRRRVDLALLDYAGVEERYLLAQLVGRCDAVSYMITCVQCDEDTPAKTRRLLVAECLDGLTTQIDTHLRAVRSMQKTVA